MPRRLPAAFAIKLNLDQLKPMGFLLIDILSYSVALGAVIGLLRIKVIGRAYLPFILLLWVALLNEVAGTILISLLKSNAVNSNIYVLLESLLIIWFFERLGLFERPKLVFYFFITLLSAFWIVENLLIFSILKFNSYFRIFYSFIVVLMSINMINKLFSEDRRRLAKNPTFLIMIGFIAFFTYKALIEIFWIYGLNASKEFRIEVYRIMVYINFTVNLIYALAVLWIPKKREYMLL